LEGFSALLKEAQKNNLLIGVQFGAEGPLIAHLLFGDDSVVFLEVTNGSLQELRRIPHKFSLRLLMVVCKS
jgi:hypothetical protein